MLSHVDQTRNNKKGVSKTRAPTSTSIPTSTRRRSTTSTGPNKPQHTHPAAPCCSTPTSNNSSSSSPSNSPSNSSHPTLSPRTPSPPCVCAMTPCPPQIQPRPNLYSSHLSNRPRPSRPLLLLPHATPANEKHPPLLPIRLLHSSSILPHRLPECIWDRSSPLPMRSCRHPVWLTLHIHPSINMPPLSILNHLHLRANSHSPLTDHPSISPLNSLQSLVQGVANSVRASAQNRTGRHREPSEKEGISESWSLPFFSWTFPVRE